MAMGANPCGARLSVAPMMTNRKNSVNLSDKPRDQRVSARRVFTVTVGSETGSKIKTCFPTCNHKKHASGNNCTDHLNHNVR